MFMILTLAAFLFHLFGLNWFETHVKLPEPSEWVQKGVIAGLKVLELTFVYKMLTHKSFLLCVVLSIVHTVLAGFIPIRVLQSAIDGVAMLILTVIFRKDRGWAVIDFLFIYLLMFLYGLLLTVAKFGGLSLEYAYSFYANTIGIIDYKLFVVTLYLYTKYKGGIKLWKSMKRKLLS